MNNGLHLGLCSENMGVCHSVGLVLQDYRSTFLVGTRVWKETGCNVKAPGTQQTERALGNTSTGRRAGVGTGRLSAKRNARLPRPLQTTRASSLLHVCVGGGGHRERPASPHRPPPAGPAGLRTSTTHPRPINLPSGISSGKGRGEETVGRRRSLKGWHSPYIPALRHPVI